jgi:hypothetical protein
MAAASDNVYDILVWIKKVIDSTTTIEQFQNADELIELFDKKYGNWTLYKDLTMHSINHLDKLK